jgi:hypothetical protein
MLKMDYLSEVDAIDVLTVMLSSVVISTPIKNLETQLLEIVQQADNSLLGKYFPVHDNHHDCDQLNQALLIMRQGGSLRNYGPNYDNDLLTPLIRHNAERVRSKLNHRDYNYLQELGKKIN